jgi:hypothetical protein
MRRADSEVRARRQLHARSETVSVDARDHGDGKRSDRITHAMGPGRGRFGGSRIEIGHLREIGPRNEGLLARARDDDGAQGVVVP